MCIPYTNFMFTQQHGEQKWVTLNTARLLVSNGLIWIFHKPLIFWDFPTQSSREFIVDGLKKRKYPMSDSTLGKKGLVNVRGQKRMARLLCADSKTTVTHSHLLQPEEHLWIHSTLNLEAEGLHQLPLMSAKNRRLMLQLKWVHPNWRSSNFIPNYQLFLSVLFFMLKDTTLRSVIFMPIVPSYPEALM